MAESEGIKLSMYYMRAPRMSFWRQTVYKMFEQKEGESTLGFEPKIFVSAKTPYPMRHTETRQTNHMKRMKAEQSGLTSSVSSALQPGCVCSLPSLKS